MKSWDRKGMMTEELKGSQYYYRTIGEGRVAADKPGGTKGTLHWSHY